MPVIEASFRQLRDAGVGRALVITSDRKPELMQYLGNGGGIGLDLAFLQQARPDGLAAAVALALPWTNGANACLLLPDTIVRPGSALTEARALFESAKADLVLVAFALYPLRLRLCLGQRRQQQTRQDGDDGNHHQQFDQREAFGFSCITALHLRPPSWNLVGAWI